MSPPNLRFNLALRLFPPLLAVATLAVLAGAALALIPRPAHAEHVVWSATLTPRSISGDLGCWDSSSGNRLCSNALSDNTIELQDGTSIQIFGMRAEDHNTHWGFQFETLNNIPAKLSNYALEIGGLTFRFDADGIFTNNRTRQWGLQSDVGTRNLFTAGTAITVTLVDTRVAHVPPDPAEFGRSFAKAQPKTAWSATLRVGDTFRNGIYGCNDRSDRSLCSTALTDRDFTYNGETYDVQAITVNHAYANALSFTLVQDITPEMRKNLRLIVNGRSYHLTNNQSAGGQVVSWPSGKHGQVWAVGDRIRVKLVERDFPTLGALPFNRNVERIPARPPAGTPPPQTSVSAADDYCYTGDGTEHIPTDRMKGTEFVRYPDGRIAEVPKVGATTRAMFACN